MAKITASIVQPLQIDLGWRVGRPVEILENWRRIPEALIGRNQEHLLGKHRRLAVVERKLVVVFEHDCVRRACIFTIATVDAADHIDLVALGVTLANRDRVVRIVLRGIDEDRIGRTGSGTERAADTPLEAVRKALQFMLATKARAYRPLDLG